ncbi:hypothetical protein DIPPA_26489 [Diplonema papillatum]|nr:hypothetical protein DIPPA_26489 [Diplonema papillatum]
MSNAGSQRGDPWGYAKPSHVAHDPQYLNPDPRVAVIVLTEYTNAADGVHERGGRAVQSAQYNIQFVDDRGDTPAGGAPDNEPKDLAPPLFVRCFLFSSPYGREDSMLSPIGCCS